MRFDYQTTVAIGQQTIGETVVVVVEQSIQTKKHLMMNKQQTKPKQNLWCKINQTQEEKEDAAAAEEEEEWELN